MTTTTMPALAAGSYRIDPVVSTIAFTAKHLFGLGTTAGTFAIRSGHVRIGADPLVSTATVVVDAASFTTDKTRRDKDVKSKRFLDVINHPAIEVRVDDVRLAAPGWELGGELTVKGRVSPITLTVTAIEPTPAGLRAVATTVVDRYAAGITTGKGLAGRYLTMTVEVAAERI
jgi:polyisoprenoid-binding protein YceI